MSKTPLSQITLASRTSKVLQLITGYNTVLPKFQVLITKKYLNL